MLPDPSGFTLQPSPPILRRPFRVTPRGITAHGRFCFDVALASIQFEAPAEHAEQAANDRFESFLDQSTTLFGPVDPCLDTSSRPLVLQTGKPGGKGIGRQDGDHAFLL
mgnify:CR=1 FL=1